MVQFHHCSPDSSVLRVHLTSHPRSYQHYPQRGSLTVPATSHPGLIQGTDGISRFSCLKFPHMLQAFDSAAFETDLAIDDRFDVAFHKPNSVGTRNCLISELNLWACVYPCRCYTHDVTIVSVRLRASAFGYNFAVRLSHSQLQAGLSRRFLGFPACRQTACLPRWAIPSTVGQLESRFAADPRQKTTAIFDIPMWQSPATKQAILRSVLP